MAVSVFTAFFRLSGRKIKALYCNLGVQVDIVDIDFLGGELLCDAHEAFQASMLENENLVLNEQCAALFEDR